MIRRSLQNFASSFESTRSSRRFFVTVIQDSFSNLRGVDGHIPLSHTLWTQTIRKGDVVIDATCGKGLDSLVLSKLALSRDSGLLYCIDIQERAIKDTRDRLCNEYGEDFLRDRMKFIQSDHAVFPSEIESGSVSAIVYNLGYLPGTHKDGTDRIITRTESTMKSFDAALCLLKLGGVLSVTAYRGQASGPSETEACIAFFSGLGQTNWRVFSHSPINTQKGAILFTACRR